MKLPTLLTATAGLVLAMVNPASAAPDVTGAAMLEQLGNADVSRDGQITRAEMIAFRAQNFDRLDRSGDGTLTRGDIPAIAARLNPELDFNRLIAQFDGNGDGKVSRDEFVNGPSTFFDRADANGDAIVTRAELDASLAAARGKR